MRLVFHFLLCVVVHLGMRSSQGATQVKMWAINVFPSITNVPPDLTNAVAIATGSGHTLALTSEGEVVGWGNNTYGQISIPTGLSNVVAISASHSQSLALTISGELVTWGIPACESNSPLHALTNVVSVAGGTYGGFALLEDGNYVTWTCLFDHPVNPTGTVAITNYFWPAGPTSAITAAFSEGTRLSLDAEGNVLSRFRLGSFTNIITNVVSIAAGYFHAMGLTADGRVLVWSDPSGGIHAPTNITNAAAIAAGFQSGLILFSDGRLAKWGVQDPAAELITLYQGTNVLAIAAGGNLHAALLDLGGSTPVRSTLPGPRVVTDGIAINFPTERGRIYLLEHKATLTDAWSFEQLVAGNGSLREVVVPTASQGFFRTRRVR